MFLKSSPPLSKVTWERSLSATVMETTALKSVAANVSLAGRDPTAASRSVPITAGTGATAWTENVSASRVSREKTARYRLVLWTAECTVSVWVEFASA